MNTIKTIYAVKSELDRKTGSAGQADSAGSGIRIPALLPLPPLNPLYEPLSPGTEGSSPLPDLAERKIASMTAMFRTVPSNGTGNSVLSRMLRENRSP